MSDFKRDASSPSKTARVQELPIGEITLALNSPFSKQLEERIDILGLLQENSEVMNEAISDFLHHFEYLQEEYIRPLFEEEGDIYFTPEYTITFDDDEHPDHYSFVRLLASMVDQCQTQKNPNLSSDDLQQMKHISGR